MPKKHRQSAKLDPETAATQLESIRNGQALKTMAAPTDIGALNYSWEEVADGADKDGNAKTKWEKMPLPFNEVVSQICELSQDKLMAVQDLVFAKPTTPGDMMIHIEDPAQLFGFLGRINKCCIEWAAKEGCMTKAEAFSQVRHELDYYEGIESAPHYPHLPRTFYNHAKLPPPDHDAMHEFVARFAPETECDRALIYCMFLSALWGNHGEQRPVFVISSPDGRGSGKTTIAEMVAELLGQTAISGSTKQSPEEFVKRLLSPLGMASRVAIFDNETGRITSPEFAALVTCKMISGKRMYQGEGRRPNNLLWIITLNAPTLDSDFASRTIHISVKKPTYATYWKTETVALLEKKRWAIVAAFIDVLKKKTASVTPRFRWGPWEQDILAKMSHLGFKVNEVQDLITTRQKDVDDEIDEAELVRDGFAAAIRMFNSHRNGDSLRPDEGHFFFPNEFAARIYNQSTGKTFAKTTALRMLRDMHRTKVIPEISNASRRDPHFGRGIEWIGDHCLAGVQMQVVYGFRERQPGEDDEFGYGRE